MTPDPTQGHVKMPRAAYRDDPWWGEARAFSKWEAWTDCLQMAAYRAGERAFPNGTTVRLERGEFVASLRFLAERWGWTVKQVRGFVTIAGRMGRFSAQREAQHGTVYRIAAYDVWVNGGTPEGTAEGTPEGIAGAQEGHKVKAVKQEKQEEQQHQPAPPPRNTPPPAVAVGLGVGSVRRAARPSAELSRAVRPASRPATAGPDPTAETSGGGARYPHLPKATVDRLHATWLRLKGGVAYPRLRKALGESGLFPAGGPRYPDATLEAALVAAVEITQHEGGYGWRTFTPETWLGGVVEWVRLGALPHVSREGALTERGERATAPQRGLFAGRASA